MSSLSICWLGMNAFCSEKAFKRDINSYKSFKMLFSFVLISTALSLSLAWSDTEYLVSLDGVDDDNNSGKFTDDDYFLRLI